MTTQEMAKNLKAQSGAGQSSEPQAFVQSTACLATASLSVARPLAAGSVEISVGNDTGRSSFELKRAANGVAELLVTAESAAVRFGTALWAAASILAKKPAFTAAAAALGLGTLAEGALIPDGASDASYVTYGSEMAGEALSFKLSVPGVGTGERNTSATYLNDQYAITAAHNISDLLQYNPTYSVSTGSNFNSSPGTTIAVDRVTIYPGYSSGFESPDIAILHFSQPLANGPTMNIAGVSVGEVVTEAGFGHHGSPSTGSLPVDGNSRAWDAPIVPGNTSNVSDTYYFSTAFDGAHGIAMNGKGLSGDSGGPVVDANGNLVGIGIGQYGDTDTLGGTESLMLSQPEVYAWIEANTAIPEPSAAAVVISGISFALLRRSRLTT